MSYKWVKLPIGGVGSMDKFLVVALEYLISPHDDDCSRLYVRGAVAKGTGTNSFAGYIVLTNSTGPVTYDLVVLDNRKYDERALAPLATAILRAISNHEPAAFSAEVDRLTAGPPRLYTVYCRDTRAISTTAYVGPLSEAGMKKIDELNWEFDQHKDVSIVDETSVVGTEEALLENLEYWGRDIPNAGKV